MKTPILLICILSISLSWSQNSKARMQNVENGLMLPTIFSTNKKGLEKNIIQSLKKHKINGASVAVIHNGKLDWSNTYGVTDADELHPVTTNTLFQCASIGKAITAIATLKLVEEGKLNLDENINNKLKRWQLKDNAYTETSSVTLRHLLSHSAGLSDEYGFLGYKPTDDIPTLLETINNAPSTNTKKELTVKAIPGTEEKYSGGGYLIIQILIEDVTGLPFSDYVQQQILDPLHMSNTTYVYQPDSNENYQIASGHRSNGKTFKNKKYHIYPEKAAAGPWTTAEDLANFVLAIQNAIHNESNAILNQELITEFITPQINRRGLGINLRGVEKPEAFWHSGQNLGYTGLIYGLTGKEEGAIILLNSEGGETLLQEFIGSVANAYDWPVMKSYESLEIPKTLKTKLVGTYTASEQQKSVSIVQKKETLYLQSDNSKSKYQLYRIGENHYTFKDAQDYYKLEFSYKNGKVNSLVYVESIGHSIELLKVE